MAKASTQTKAPSFSSILDEPASEARRPPTIPRGYYICVVQGHRIDRSSLKQTEFVEYTLKVLSVWEKDGIPQADEDELADFGEVKDQLIRVTFYLTDKSKYRLREFLEHCGVEIEPGASFSQLIPEATNCQVIAHVVHEPWQSGEGVNARVRGTAPIED